jgi:excisionase family DNA binding protein
MTTFSPPSFEQRRRRPRAVPAAAASPRPSPALLTIEDVAAQLAASDRHVRRLIERGELPVHRIGRLVRVSPDDLARLIAASRHA